MYYICRNYFAFGMQEDLSKAVHCLLVLVLVHFILCYKEENTMRETFYKEIDLLSTRESFRKTLDSVPETLLIRSRASSEVLFTNKALKEMTIRLYNDSLK